MTRSAALVLAAAIFSQAPAVARAEPAGSGVSPAHVGEVLVAQARAEVDLSARAVPRARTVAILVLSGEEIGVPLSQIYSDARSVIEAHTALTVAPLDVISLDERAAVVRECAGRGACFAQKVRESATASNVSLLLTVSADRLDEGFLLGFRLVDVDTSRDVGAAGDEVPAGMSMLGAMEQQLPGVFPASIWDQISTVQVETTPANAEVTVGGRACASPCELTRMAPGGYEVTVRKAGFAPWTGSVTLDPRETSKVTATLEPLETSGGVLSSWVFWAAVGAVVVGGTAAAVVLAQPSDRVVSICIAEDRSLCE
ncbi:PEGA domain-containing protein [Myxococcota bacterium]|nr:PEGA domain-containing protein [Myxococcota bacterium]